MSEQETREAGRAASRSGVSPRLRVMSVGAYCLVGLLIVCGALGGRAGIERANDVIDRQWRGSYDILVTAPGGVEAISPGGDPQGLTLIDSNFAAQSLPTMSDALVSQVGQVSGVEVAAPVGFVGRLANTAPFPLVIMGEMDLAAEPVQSFTVRWSISEHDGVSERVIFDRTNTLRIDASAWTGQSGYASDVGVSVTADTAPNDMYLQFVQFGVLEGYPDRLVWGVGPSLATTVVAVDPVAERELLGEEGDFLDPLISFEAMLAERGGMTASGFYDENGELGDTSADPEVGPYPGAQFHNRPAIGGQYGWDSPFVGYVANAGAYPDTRIRLSVQQQVGDELRDLGTSELNMGASVGPFLSGDLSFPWPGEARDLTGATENYVLNSDHVITELSPVAMTSRESPVEGRAAFEATFRQYLAPFRLTDLSVLEDAVPGTRPGEEVSYRATNDATGMRIGTRQTTGIAPFEVSSFEPGDADPLLGLYAKASMVLPDGRMLAPSRHGTSIATEAPDAIVSLGAARGMSDADVVTAIRVRVAGLEGLTRDEALAWIDDVARSIRSLGLEATVVAGASTEEVSVFVPTYAFGSPDGVALQEVGELGWTTVTYSVLGAASWTASLTTSTVNTTTLLCLLVSAICLVGLGFLARAERRGTHALLASLGWRTPRRLAWVAREELPGLVVCVLGGVVGVVFAPGQSRWGAAAGLAALVLSFAIANPVRSRRLTISSGLGTRVSRLGLAGVEAVSLTVSALLVGTIVAVIGWFQTLVRRTRLGEDVIGTLVPILGVLGLTVAILAILGVVSARHSMRVTRRVSHFRYWSLSQPLWLIRLRHGAIVIASALLALGGLWVLDRRWDLATRLTGGAQSDGRTALTIGMAWIGVWLVTRLIIVWVETRRIRTDSRGR